MPPGVVPEPLPSDPPAGNKFEPEYPHRINPSNVTPLLAKYDYKLAYKTFARKYFNSCLLHKSF